MRYHLTQIRMVIIKKSINNKCWRECGEKESFHSLVGIKIGAATMENNMEVP